LSSREADDIKEILELVKYLKNRGATGGAVTRSFCRRLIQQIKDRVLVRTGASEDRWMVAPGCDE
jgi:coenzyme F420-reducing hydrogenase beta subunit